MLKIKQTMTILNLIKILNFDNEIRSPGWLRYQKKLK